MGQTVEDSLEGTSPRSTILVVASRDLTMNPEDASSGGQKIGAGSGSAAGESPDQGTQILDTSGDGGGKSKTSPSKAKSEVDVAEDNDPLSPSQPNNLQTSYGVVPAGGGAFYGYPSQPHLTPRGNYYGDVFPASQPTFVTNPFTTVANNPNPSPLSPPRTTVVPNMGTAVPPASPLFPRLNHNSVGGLGAAANAQQFQEKRNNSSNTANPPPSPGFGYAGLGYATYSNAGAQLVPGTQLDETNSWAGERNLQQLHSASPQVHSQGMPMQYPVSRATTGGRAYSFEELPPPILPSDGSIPEMQPGNPAYSPYGGSTTSSATANGTLFATHQQWPYLGIPPDMYGTTPASPLQPRPAIHMPLPHPHMAYPGGVSMGGMRHMGPGQPYGASPYATFTAGTSSPGPPIQTTASNKGPDGANLFIFHIPNHFTNLDMYQLFEPYGNLLSVRIMVEKDTGRSRGFGFVSYDSPESAALAIKALNGFAIGNKRLKVQHKQIRPKDMHERDQSNGFDSSGVDGYTPQPLPPHYQQQGLNTLPPSGPSSWYSHDRKVGGVEQDTNDNTTDSTVGVETATYPSEHHPLSPLDKLGSLQAALPNVSDGVGNSSVNPASGAGEDDSCPE